jgi:hypothetical protein
MVRGLLVGVSKLDQLGLTPRSPHEFHADRQTVGGEAARNNNGRQAGVGGKLAVGAQLNLADQVRLAADRWVGKGVHAIVSHCLQDRHAECCA